MPDRLLCAGRHVSARIVRDLLDHLPQRAGAQPRRWPAVEPPDGAYAAELDDTRAVYDVRDVLRTLVDRGRVLEVNARWARNVVTAYARIDGRAIGIVANQPKFLGGALNADGACKAARFVNGCDAFGLPLVVLVDTPASFPGRRRRPTASFVTVPSSYTRLPPRPCRG